MLFRQLFDAESSTYTYLLADEATREAVIVDPVLEQAERDATIARELGLTLLFAIETHVHADHVTGGGTLRDRLGCKTVLSERGGTGAPDMLVKEGDVLRFGRYGLEVRETPGHTSGCLTYVTLDRAMAFTGDTLLVRGTGRTDFQEGNARTLFRSVREKIFVLPDETLLYPAHDYRGRTVTTVGEEKRHNPRLGLAKSEDEFVEIMANLKLAYPKQIDRALPLNLVCGVPTGLRADGEKAAVRDWAPLETTQAGVPEVTAEWVAANPAAGRLVDVREADEFVGPLGHAPGAKLVPLASVEGAAAAWDREAPLVLVCRSGGRSGKAAIALRHAGFTRVASLRGGMTRWNELKLPIETGTPAMGSERA